MFTYRAHLAQYTIDYYTDEHQEYAPVAYTWSGETVWEARLRMRLFLLEKLSDTTIVDFYNISLEVSCNAEHEWYALGAWRLSEKASYGWDWEAEARFLKKYKAYRQGDRELLALEKAYYQTPKKDIEQQEAIAQNLADFEAKYENSLDGYASEIGLLYFFLGYLENAFAYLTCRVLPCLRLLTYQVASRLAYFGTKANYAYLQKYDALYPEGRPFLGS